MTLMAATDNNLLDSIFYFFTKPLIVYKIFYFLWSNETLGENSFFINSPVDNLEDVLYKIRDDFALSTQEYSTFRDKASKKPTLNFSLLFDKAWMKATFGTIICGVTILWNTKESF